MMFNFMKICFVVLTVGVFCMFCSSTSVAEAEQYFGESAKLEFRYTNHDGKANDLEKGGIFKLEVYGEINAGEPVFENESLNSAGVGWDNSLSFYQELNCPTYDSSYLCIPSIDLVLSTRDFFEKKSWSIENKKYEFLGTMEIHNLEHFGKVTVVSNTMSGVVFKYYFSQHKGLVAFSINVDSEVMWTLNKEEPFGVGAISFSKSRGEISPLNENQKKVIMVKSAG